MSEAPDEGPFYHGTKADLRVGDLLTAGYRSNYRPEVVMNHIYFTALRDGAGLAAELAAGDAEPRVYVEPRLLPGRAHASAHRGLDTSIQVVKLCEQVIGDPNLVPLPAGDLSDYAGLLELADRRVGHGRAGTDQALNFVGGQHGVVVEDR